MEEGPDRSPTQGDVSATYTHTYTHRERESEREREREGLCL